MACACDLGKHGVIAWMRVRMTIKNIRTLACHVSYSELELSMMMHFVLCIIHDLFFARCRIVTREHVGVGA